jgi:hypothetical protein
MKAAVRRLVARAAAVIVPAGALVAVLAAPAQAYSCTGGYGILFTHYQNLSSANVTFYPRCSDNKAHFSGWVHDIACDHRAARVSLIANGGSSPDGQWYELWSRQYNASNGCNTTASFSGSAAALTGNNWELEVDLGACSTTCAMFDPRTIRP